MVLRRWGSETQIFGFVNWFERQIGHRIEIESWRSSVSLSSERNASFQSLYGGQFTLSIQLINPKLYIWICCWGQTIEDTFLLRHCFSKRFPAGLRVRETICCGRKWILKTSEWIYFTLASRTEFFFHFINSSIVFCERKRESMSR